MAKIPNPQSPISKVLIANRGEIAVRILRACREMGLRTVAVYSEADARALHVQLADEAVCIGPAPARDSYLQSEQTIKSAKDTGAQAIHPGYGFLSENAAFAQAVTDAGLIFIGPPASAIEAMGDKANARALMLKAGVPVVPGYQGDDQSDSTLTAEAARIGYPILVKAAAGGGGKGMRIAPTPADLPDALAAARREALHAFNDDRLILEKYLSDARHIEIQILADQHGNTIHLNERECSVQRRHQKIIEETPSPLLDDPLRSEMGAAAIAAAQAVNYTSAGTIEFIVDPHTRQYYFLEMNTRLQVEHPITELITGLDLVQQQIRIASGESLPQYLISNPQYPRGHAIEARLYAEDPASGFLPATGPLLQFIPPTGPGIRVDTGFQTGDILTTHYDPLLAKIIVHAEDRSAALRKMQTALRDTILLGLTTNLEFLQTVLAHPVFQAGTATTRFIEQHLPDWHPPTDLPLEVLLAAALTSNQLPVTSNQSTGQPYSPWTALPNFRLGQSLIPNPQSLIPNLQSPISNLPVKHTFSYLNHPHELTLTPSGPGYRATYQGKTYEITRHDTAPGQITLTLDGRTVVYHVAADRDLCWVAVDGRTYRLKRETRPAHRTRRAHHAGDDNPEGILHAPMPGQVRAIHVQVGDPVTKGQTLLLLEAMKMEIRIQAPADGTVAKIAVKVGDQVEKEQTLAVIE